MQRWIARRKDWCDNQRSLETEWIRGKGRRLEREILKRQTPGRWLIARTWSRHQSRRRRLQKSGSLRFQINSIDLIRIIGVAWYKYFLCKCFTNNFDIPCLPIRRNLFVFVDRSDYFFLSHFPRNLEKFHF